MFYTCLLVYLLLINALGWLLMLIDKRRAQKRQWRIRESTLMTVAAMGGSVGSLIGMYTVRHKTQHPKFTIGIPVILALQVLAALAIFLLRMV